MIVDRPWFPGAILAVTAAAIGLWLVMAFGSLAHLQALAGQPVFDMRLMGYDFETARSILGNLGPDGIAYYLDRQHTYDGFFPALAFLTVSGWEIWLTRKLAIIGHSLPVWLIAALIVVNLVGAIADYGENGAVRQMLLAGAAALTEADVESASRMTLAKSVLNSLSYTLLLVLAGYHVFRRRTP